MGRRQRQGLEGVAPVRPCITRGWHRLTIASPRGITGGHRPPQDPLPGCARPGHTEPAPYLPAGTLSRVPPPPQPTPAPLPLRGQRAAGRGGEGGRRPVGFAPYRRRPPLAGAGSLSTQTIGVHPKPLEGVRGVAGGRCNRPPPDPLPHLPAPPPRALALAATRPRGSVGAGKGALASRQCATGGAPQKGAPARTRGRGTGERDRTPPPVRLPTPRPEGGGFSPFGRSPSNCRRPLATAAGMAQRPQISKPLNPASRGSLTAEPNGATRRGGEDCEAGWERWNCGGGLAPPSNHRPGCPSRRYLVFNKPPCLRLPLRHGNAPPCPLYEPGGAFRCPPPVSGSPPAHTCRSS